MMYTPFLIGCNWQYGPYAHFEYWTLTSDPQWPIKNGFMLRMIINLIPKKTYCWRTLRSFYNDNACTEYMYVINILFYITHWKYLNYVFINQLCNDLGKTILSNIFISFVNLFHHSVNRHVPALNLLFLTYLGFLLLYFFLCSLSRQIAALSFAFVTSLSLPSQCQYSPNNHVTPFSILLKRK